ncbi:TPA: hypothetical protein ACWLWR_001302 [Morganella morganii]|uniref:hypothetical protein n=1 Tax=Morganella morganii TaxID=582 RepID=UPI00163B4AB1|nr:hypothetical protein [Morganella morganii]HEI8864349.1 hypothetical protein [Morganella morganii]
MTPQEAENGRRRVARECLKELMQYTSDEQHTAILDKYTPKFKPLNHLPFPEKKEPGYYVRTLQQENEVWGLQLNPL